MLVLGSLLLVGSTAPVSSTEPLQLIESDDTRVAREGNWMLQATPSASGGSYLYSSGSVGDALTLLFAGPRVAVVYVAHPALGTLALEIDNVVVRTVITTSEETVFGMRAVVDYLQPGTHTLRVFAVTGTIALDAFYAIPFAGEPVETTELASPLSVPGPSSGCPLDIDDNTALPIWNWWPPYAVVDSLADFKLALEKSKDLLPAPYIAYTICVRDGVVYQLDETIHIDSNVNIYSLGLEGKKAEFTRQCTPGLCNQSPDQGGAGFYGVLFHIHAGVTVEFSHLHIYGAWHHLTPGSQDFAGAILNFGTLKLFDSRLSNNFVGGPGAEGLGGAIYSEGSLTLYRTVMVSNRASYAGATIHNGGSGDFTAACSQFYGGYSFIGGNGLLNSTNSAGTAHIQQSSFDANGYYASGFHAKDIINLAADPVQAGANFWYDGPSVSYNGWPLEETYQDVVTQPLLDYDPTDPYGGGFNDDCAPLDFPKMPGCQGIRVSLITETDYLAVGRPGWADELDQIRQDSFAAQNNQPVLIGSVANQYFMISSQLQTKPGLVLYKAPAINAKVMDVIPWDSSVCVTGRFEYDKGSTADQIWYEAVVDDTQIPPLKYWFLAQINNHIYIQDASQTDATVSTSVPNPPNEILFFYDPQVTALYAIQRSMDNFLYTENNTFTNGAVTIFGIDPTNQVFADDPLFPIYPEIQGATGSTGSSAFMSQSLWHGGIPMTMNTDLDELCKDDNEEPSWQGGWRYCPGQSQRTASVKWTSHELVTANLVHLVRSQNLVEIVTGLNWDEDIVNLGANLTSDNPRGDVLAEFMQDGNQEGRPEFKNIRSGDYFYINSTDCDTGSDGICDEGIDQITPASHGFTVVGWGPVISCNDVPNHESAIRDGSYLTLIYDTASGNPQTPYVADFSYDHAETRHGCNIQVQDHFIALEAQIHIGMTTDREGVGSRITKQAKCSR